LAAGAAGLVTGGGIVAFAGKKAKKADADVPDRSHMYPSEFHHHQGELHGLEDVDHHFPPPATEVPHWSYAEGEGGPQNWGKLCASYSAAYKGREQSPIDFFDHETIQGDEELSELVFNYACVPASLENNGHSMQVNFSPGTLQIDGRLLRLMQLHFHTPSEHTINGKRYPMEMHLVHKDDRGLAVLAVLYEYGDTNMFLDQFWDKLPKKAGETVDLASVDINAMHLRSAHYFRYQGSLTTPPCSEGVNWTVMRRVHTASPAQLEVFKEKGGFVYPRRGNNRPTQAVNARRILTYKLDR